MITVNEYFNATVKSLGYKTENGNSTVGVMEPGEYEFGTSAPEVMTVIQGELVVQLAGTETWVSYTASKSFDVPGNSSFKVKAIGQTSYLCEYN